MLARKTTYVRTYVRIYVCSSSDPWHLVTDGWDLPTGAHPHINMMDIFVDAASADNEAIAVKRKNTDIDFDGILNDFLPENSPNAGGGSTCGSSVVVIDDIDCSKTSATGEQMPREIDAQPQRSDSDLTKKAATKKRVRRAQNISRKPSASGTSLLTRFDPFAGSPTGEENLWQTIFVHPTGKESSRSTSSDIPYLAVCIWPQYQIFGVNGSFAVVAQGEQWLDSILHSLRCRSSQKNPTDSFKALMPTFNRTMNEMLRNGLLASRQKGAPDIDLGTNEDDEHYPTVKTLSGFHLKDVKLIKITVAGITFNVVNYAKMMIIKVDEAGIQFMKTVIVDVARKLTLKAKESVYQPEAPYQFDIELRNIRDKVVWDPDQNGWQVRFKPGKAANAKGKGKKATTSQPSIKEPEPRLVKVPDNLEGKEFDIARRAAYVEAIKLWNELDGRKGPKIAVPSDTTSPVKTEAPGRCSNVSDVCLTLGQKWDADADMIRTS